MKITFTNDDGEVYATFSTDAQGFEELSPTESLNRLPEGLDDDRDPASLHDMLTGCAKWIRANGAS